MHILYFAASGLMAILTVVLGLAYIGFMVPSIDPTGHGQLAKATMGLVLVGGMLAILAGGLYAASTIAIKGLFYRKSRR